MRYNKLSETTERWYFRQPKQSEKNEKKKDAECFLGERLTSITKVTIWTSNEGMT